MLITRQILDQFLVAIDMASQAALQIYGEDDFGIEYKNDKSPVTRADLKVNEILTDTLKRLTPKIPIISEEANISYESRKDFERFWIIDPIDGTKEFIKRTDEFTINLGLIDRGRPVFGIIAIPTSGEVFYGGQEILEDGKIVRVAVRRVNDPNGGTRSRSIRVREFAPMDYDEGSFAITVTCSRDHRHPDDWKFIECMMLDHYIQLVPCGSTIKICRIAEGNADVYIRMSGINDWDLAAGHAIIEAAGGSVTTLDGQQLEYNTAKQRLLPFIVYGETKLDWQKWAADDNKNN